MCGCTADVHLQPYHPYTLCKWRLAPDILTLLFILKDINSTRYNISNFDNTNSVSNFNASDEEKLVNHSNIRIRTRSNATSPPKMFFLAMIISGPAQGQRSDTLITGHNDPSHCNRDVHSTFRWRRDLCKAADEAAPARPVRVGEHFLQLPWQIFSSLRYHNELHILSTQRALLQKC